MTSDSVTAYLGLGSNEGNRHQYLLEAIQILNQHDEVHVANQSMVHETAPVSHIEQGDFLNQVVHVETALDPPSLLRVCLDTEASLGRVREERWGPRTIDIDILFYGDEIIQLNGLTIPHPEVHKRSFMLTPLAEIAPEHVHPVLKSSIAAMLQLL